MKAQLAFLSIFMKVLLMLLILAFCFMGNSEKESVCAGAQQNSETLAIRNVTDVLLHSVHLQRL
ncbi:hypothetical protein [Spirosoma sp.]|uniref:hypothetical protein n=1 Tax=Spirosoma sp. TaxID=1899569 RepID=UPI003B3B6EFB